MHIAEVFAIAKRCDDPNQIIEANMTPALDYLICLNEGKDELRDDIDIQKIESAMPPTRTLAACEFALIRCHTSLKTMLTNKRVDKIKLINIVEGLHVVELNILKAACRGELNSLLENDNLRVVEVNDTEQKTSSETTNKELDKAALNSQKSSVEVNAPKPNTVKKTRKTRKKSVKK